MCNIPRSPWWLIIAILIAGCTRTPEAKDFDSERARQTLLTTLEAWKNGQAQKLAHRQPPIRFVDDDWSAGWQLSSYQLQDPDSRIRAFETVFVELRLRNRQGKTAQRVAGYQIVVQSRLAVLRAEF